MMDQLEQLSSLGTVVVADTGDFNSLKQFTPTDVTTNPSLLMAAASMPEYAPLVNEAIAFGRGEISATMNKLAVNFGAEIIKTIPGLISTEVDPSHSFSTEKTVAQARELIKLYDSVGVPTNRVLIKVAATWEGIRAAEILEREGIHVNMTLIFSIYQAVAAAEAGATLISPFVGRILDWYKAAEKVDGYPGDKDPGVKSVSEIWTYYQKFGYKTIVMGASFRNKEEILALAGCDKLTIGPKFLEELKKSSEKVTRRLVPESAKHSKLQKISVDEESFRFMMNEDTMATEKLAQGIRQFAADTRKLMETLAAKIAKGSSPSK
uniref:Transaldolase n=1 Tax=Spongospora subterranea TaxID=70186 RepID=A0A0H5RAQ6_9EUKA|eukprot:CRZ11250.1 hypothetical protein [Spongospora subterranea]